MMLLTWIVGVLFAIVFVGLAASVVIHLIDEHKQDDQ